MEKWVLAFDETFSFLPPLLPLLWFQLTNHELPIFHTHLRFVCVVLCHDKNCRLKMNSLPCDFNLCLYLRLINKIQCLVSNRPLWFQTIHGRVNTHKKIVQKNRRKEEKPEPERTKCRFSPAEERQNSAHTTQHSCCLYNYARHLVPLATK